MIQKFEEFINEQSESNQDLEIKKPEIFCDLDGVLVDFERGFIELSSNTEKLSPRAYEKKHGKNSIWKLIDKLGEEFWTGLYWMSDGRELWDYIKRYDPIILSAPSNHPGCITGKTKWVKQNLGINDDPVRKPEDVTPETRFILDKLKYKYAKGPQSILIDDTDEKIESWTKAGGTGILHDDATDTVRVLDKLIEKTE